MALRLIKVILPDEKSGDALKLLEEKKPYDFWQEEAAGGQCAIAVLTSPGNSEEIMDCFEKRFKNLPGFRLILMPVQAALPRPEPEEEGEPKPGEDEKKKGIGTLRISREELYGSVADSSRLSWVYILMVIISTIVVSIGLLKSNVAIIIGAMVVAPLLGPNVAAALATTLADSELGREALQSLLIGVGIVLDTD